MSESDSFIQEVTEEVQRDRLFGLVRRYGWIVGLAILVIVGGAAWNEWRKAQAQAQAETFGDSLVAALDTDDPAARSAALSEADAPEAAAPFLAMLRAGDRLAAEAPAEAAEIYRTLAGDTSLPLAYSDLAALKLVLMGDDGAERATRTQILERLAQPGAPYRILALEQQIVAAAAAGEDAQARSLAESLLQEPGLTQPIVQRVAQLLVVLDLPDDQEAE